MLGFKHTMPNLVLEVKSMSSGLADLHVQDRLGTQASTRRVGLGLHPCDHSSEFGEVGAGHMEGAVPAFSR